MLTYEPGDSFDLFWPNRATEVEDMLDRLGLYHQRGHTVHICLRKDTKKKGKIGLPYIFSMPLDKTEHFSSCPSACEKVALC